MTRTLALDWRVSELQATPRRIEALLAIDRPDRLELEYDGAVVLDESSAPGSTIELTTPAGMLFRGVVSRRGFEIASGVSSVRISALAAFDARRALRASDTYFQSSDAEIAARIASELGLEPRVERTRVVHERLERRGDPLCFLRARAREIDYELAVSGGRLWFGRRLPSVEEISPRLALRRVRPRDGVLSLEIEDRGALGRGGELRLRRDDTWRPLDAFELAGFGTSWDGTYRVIRCAHARDETGARTAVTFLERGGDLERFRGRAAARTRDGDTTNVESVSDDRA